LLSSAWAEARKLRAGELARLRERLSSLAEDEPPARMLLNHLGVVRTLTTGPAAELVRRDRSLTRKYVAPYLAQSLNHVERRSILLFHNAYLARELNGLFFKEAARPEQPIWSASNGDSDQKVWVKTNDLLGGEGDLTLVFAGTTCRFTSSRSR
jgi:hypothetical protein